MKWFKHFTRAHEDRAVGRLIHEFGVSGYGLYFYCVEIIAGSLDGDNITFELEPDVEILAKRLSMDTILVGKIMHRCIELGLFEITDVGRITCMKIGHFLDKASTSNPEIRKIVGDIRQSEIIRIHQDSSQQIRLDEIRQEEKEEDKNTEYCAGSEGRPSSPGSSSEPKAKIRRPKTVYTAGRSATDKELEDHIRKRFVAERPFTEYAKQNKCVKLLAIRYCNNEPDPHNRVSLFDKMFDTFLKWKQEDKFYKTMPFTPCTMIGTTTFDKLYDAAKKRLTTADNHATIPPCPVCGCTLYDTHCTLCGIEVSLFGDKKAVEDYARAQGRTV